MDGGQVNRSWYTSIVSHSYGGLGGGVDGGGWQTCWTKPGGGHMSGDAEALPECEEKMLLTLDYTACQVRGSW